jgi:hypothetical protein
MMKRESSPNCAPLCSVIVAAYNDWVPLDHCLRSLAGQSNAPDFEVVVVDDGSKAPSPDFVHRWEEHYPLTVIRQSHRGIAAARNRGIAASKGSILVFVDADCKLAEDCLAVLAETIARSPKHNCFQLHLTGDCSGLVGRAEELRLLTIQEHRLQPDGSIRYLNTAGCAIRRESVNAGGSVFDPSARRSEDTLFLANLIQAGELPLFVPSAFVQHAIHLSLVACLLKDVRSAYLDRWAADLIAAMGIRLRASHQERLDMLASMWKTSKRQSIGRMAWFVVVTRHGLGRLLYIAYGFLRIRPRSSVPVSCY